ncbi:uncharacterized protein ACO6RY_17082 [Pungitius sinensis]
MKAVKLTGGSRASPRDGGSASQRRPVTNTCEQALAYTQIAEEWGKTVGRNDREEALRSGDGGWGGRGGGGGKSDLQEQRPPVSSELHRATEASVCGNTWGPAPLRKHPSDRHYCNPEVIH